MNKLISVIAILFLLIGIPAVFAQSGDAQGGVVAEQTETQDLGPASQEMIDTAKTYLKEKLGDSYYKEHLIFESGESYMDCSRSGCITRNEISFRHSLPFDIINPAVGNLNFIIVTLNEDGDVVRYIGPMRAYKFDISEERAMELAGNYGLEDVAGASIEFSYSNDSGYEIVWAVSSNDIATYGEVLREPIYKGVYVDVDTGMVRGEYTINPMIQTPGGYGLVALGQDLYENQEDTNINISEESMSLWTIGLIILGILIVVIFIISRVYKK